MVSNYDLRQRLHRVRELLQVVGRVAVNFSFRGVVVSVLISVFLTFLFHLMMFGVLKVKLVEWHEPYFSFHLAISTMFSLFMIRGIVSMKMRTSIEIVYKTGWSDYYIYVIEMFALQCFIHYLDCFLNKFFLLFIF